MSSLLTRPIMPTADDTAQQLHALGIAAVPASGKRPALASWHDYNDRRPTADELASWQFGDGIGVITGAVSGVICIDFDDPQLAERFALIFPALANAMTYREQSLSGGCHWWYRLPPRTNPQTRKLATGELRATGAFTVVAPTSGYVVTGGSWDDLHTLTFDELTGIEAFFTPPAQFESEPMLSRDANIASRLTDFYQHHATNTGRNNALFMSAVRGRDAGLSQSAVVDVLLHQFAADHPHIGTKQTSPHSERYELRRAEGLATIRSAFSRPSRPTSRKADDDAAIPNAIRERLLQLKQTATARVLETLSAAHKLGESMTMTEILEICQPAGVGRHSVLKALNFAVNGEIQIFSAASGILPPTESRKTKSQKQTAEPQINAIEDGKNRILIHAGRPTGTSNRWQIPTISALALALNVKIDAGSDELPTEATTSAKDYRQALHRELIARRPGQYAAAWLARRVGVTRRTIANYNKRIGIVVTQVAETLCEIVRENAAALLEHVRSAVNPAHWLEDGQGRKYPALAGLAFKLLGERQRLFWKRQAPNHYAVFEAF